MDWTLFLIIVGAGAGLIGLVALMLHRAWGDFPGRLMPYELEASSGHTPSWAVRRNEDDEDEENADQDAPAWSAGAPAEELLPVVHPGMRRAIIQALERGGSPYATYFVRDGDQIYLAAYRIADPEQRAQVTRIFHSINSDEIGGLSIYDMLQVMTRLGRQ